MGRRNYTIIMYFYDGYGVSCVIGSQERHVQHDARHREASSGSDGCLEVSDIYIYLSVIKKKCSDTVPVVLSDNTQLIKALISRA